ncbi:MULTISPECIES: SMI1/KNR4 family protein [Micromonospora]|uniref:SMI1/KNR4 family protein n=1 Tax=Micromonospora sp. HUAS YX12 TaxID=3156396 RepID=A0AAU7QZ94_9ACTN
MYDPAALEALVAPPSREVPPVDWQQLEERLEFALPLDYKWLVERYGPGSFGDFFRVFQPACQRQGIDLEYQHERTSWALEYLVERGHSLPRMPSELLAFGRSDNGDVAYWITSSSDDPNNWKVAVGEARGPLWEEFDGGVVEWLTAVLSRSYRVAIFPKDFPRRHPAFHPYDL